MKQYSNLKYVIASKPTGTDNALEYNTYKTRIIDGERKLNKEGSFSIHDASIYDDRELAINLSKTPCNHEVVDVYVFEFRKDITGDIVCFKEVWKGEKIG